MLGIMVENSEVVFKKIVVKLEFKLDKVKLTVTVTVGNLTGVSVVLVSEESSVNRVVVASTVLVAASVDIRVVEETSELLALKKIVVELEFK